MDFSSFSVNQTWKHAESIHLYHGATFFTTVFFFFFLIKTNAWKPKLYLGRKIVKKWFFSYVVFSKDWNLVLKKSYESGEKSKNYGW